MGIRPSAIIFWVLALLASGAAARAEPQWLNLPPTPSLPKPEQSGYAPVNGVRIWYATFGRGAPVLLLHGGLANSNYWGNQVRHWPRAIGSSSWTAAATGAAPATSRPYGYDLMASDVLGLTVENGSDATEPFAPGAFRREARQPNITLPASEVKESWVR